MSILTAQEQKILSNLAKGMLYKEIALQEGVTMDTVKKHCHNIYKKLHVRNKTEAINLYVNTLISAG
jgi:two-component system, NarL family, response regulator LiaR